MRWLRQLQRMPASNRWDILEALAAHGEDANDHNLPLMVWYAAEPLAVENPARALDLAAKAKLPLLAFMVRRIAAIGTPQSVALLVEHARHDRGCNRPTHDPGTASTNRSRAGAG